MLANRWFSAALRNAAESAEAKRARARDSRAVSGLIAAEAGRFALFAGVAGVLLASGLAALIVAAVVAIVYGWPWLFLAAALLLAAAGVIGARTAIELLGWKHVLSRPWKRNQVFISYRTREHAEEAAEAARALEQRSLGCFFARPGTMTKGEGHPLAGFQALKLFQAGGLDADLQRALIESDAMVFFVPGAESRSGQLEGLRDAADTMIAMTLFFSGLSRTFWRYVWYASIYGRGVAPRLWTQLDRRSWQDWELAIAHQLGLVLVKVRVAPGPATAEGEEDVIAISGESFAREFAERVVPRLSAAVRRELPVGTVMPSAVGTVLAFVVAALALVLTFLAIAALLILELAGALALGLTVATLALLLALRR